MIKSLFFYDFVNAFIAPSPLPSRLGERSKVRLKMRLVRRDYLSQNGNSFEKEPNKKKQVKNVRLLPAIISVFRGSLNYCRRIKES